MILTLTIIVLLTILGQTAMICKLLKKIERSTDRIIESLDALHDLIKLLVSDERLCK